MDGIRQWIEAEGSGHYYFYFFPVALIILFILLRDRRIKFLVPSLIICLVIINPVFYRMWDGLGLYAYWRILWVVPIIPVLACLIPAITERIEDGALSSNGTNIHGKAVKVFLRSIIVLIGASFVAATGSFLYNSDSGMFVDAENVSKLPETAIEIADRLLELAPHPRIIAQDPIGVYIRQYTGSIDILFGRDLYGFIFHPSNIAQQINGAIGSSNWEMVNQIMLDDGYDYLVVSNEPDQGLVLVDCAGGYGIYKATGHPNVIKERNELGQVISTTTVDENGEPVNGYYGYATVHRVYDNYGNILREYYTDLNDIGVTDINGCAGYERDYDRLSRLVNEKYIDANNELSSNIMGYTELKRQYRDNETSIDLFFSKGKPFTFLAGYSGIEQKRDNGRLISQTYLDTNGVPTMRSDGYSKVLWTENEDGILNVHFEDLDGNEVPVDGKNLVKDIKYDNNGWSTWMTPKEDAENYCFTIGSVNLGEKSEGDMFICQIEIEFRNVTATEGADFSFWTQGAQDGTWSAENIWNPDLIKLDDTPSNGIYNYNCVVSINERMRDVSFFDIGFRCDNWKSGSFRVRKVVIGKGKTPMEWSPGL